FPTARLGLRAAAVSPQEAAHTEREAPRADGPEREVHATHQDALRKRQELERAQRVVDTPTSDAPDAIAGLVLVGRELMEDAAKPGVVVVPIGGGGLMSGVAAVVNSVRPATGVIGVEPAGAPGMTESLRQNAPAHLDSTNTIADGLAAPFVGVLNF